MISVLPDLGQLFAAWFTYDVQRPVSGSAMLGEPGHRWLTAQGSYAGNRAELTLFVTVGGAFDSATPATTTDPSGDGT